MNNKIIKIELNNRLVNILSSVKKSIMTLCVYKKKSEKHEEKKLKTS